jgi:RimJ/RimL family protein N-acetyltransferase
MKWDPAPTSAEYEKTWREWLPKMAAGTDAYLVIRLGRNGEFLGLAGLHKIDTAEPFVGIWIKEARQGEGYGREAVSALISFASRVLGKSRLVYPVAVENRASRRVAEKLGGTIAGTWTLRKRGGIELPALTYSIAAGSQPE